MDVKKLQKLAMKKNCTPNKTTALELKTLRRRIKTNAKNGDYCMVLPKFRITNTACAALKADGLKVNYELAFTGEETIRISWNPMSKGTF